MRVVVAGGRRFNDYNLLKIMLLHYFKNFEMKDIEIISGNARGADKLGERFADEFGCSKKIFIPDWDTHKKAAGYERNKEMAEYANENGNGYCVCFWDEKSKGTKHMIDLATKNGLKTKTVTYKDDNKNKG
jgi:hypothetical protein